MNTSVDTSDATKRKSIFQAQWFPSAIASLALAITLGGHAFTAFNSVGYASMANDIRALNEFKKQAELASSQHDQNIQALKSEISRLQRSSDHLQAKLEELSGEITSVQKDAAKAQNDAQLAKESEKQSALSKSETRPLPNGVNEGFDNLVRKRMSEHWVEPVGRSDESKLDPDDMVVLQFALNRSGYVSAVTVANSSGSAALDQAALQAARKMAPISEVTRISDAAFAKISKFRLGITPAHMN